MLVLVGVLLSGCAETATEREPDPESPVACADRPYDPTRLYLDAGATLAGAPGAAGSAPANQGHEAFTQELQPWVSPPLEDPVHMEGNVTLDVLFEAAGPNLYGPSTELYLQFGSSRAYVAEALVSATSPAPHGTYRVNVSMPLPAGGFTLEEGDRFALLITSLREGVAGPGHRVHFGGDDPSHLVVPLRCAEGREWVLVADLKFPVILPGNQGLFTGAAPPTEDVNRKTVAFDLTEEADRLTILLRQDGGAGPKNDMDLYLLAADDTVLARSTSPGANETIVLWPENLESFLPPGSYRVRVESYSGANYTGRIHVFMERAADAH